MRGRVAAIVVTLAAAAVLAVLWPRAVPEAPRLPVESAEAAVGAPPPAEIPPAAETTRRPADDPPTTEEGDLALDETKLALLKSDPTLADRARQHRLAPAADARWEEAVEQGRYTGQDLDVAVREVFRRVHLEPRYAEDGRIEGLVIDGMTDDHPFAQAGFRAGDRIDRIQGVPLRDPAEIPSLLARLGPNFSLCAVRDGAEVCRELQLE